MFPAITRSVLRIRILFLPPAITRSILGNRLLLPTVTRSTAITATGLMTHASMRLASNIALVFIVKSFFAVSSWLGVGRVVGGFIVKARGGSGGGSVADFLRWRERAAVGEGHVVASTVWGGIVVVEVIDVVSRFVVVTFRVV
ncbi:hypothetical protein HanRHA438_Chr14g0663181 [Helianthus annuus]|nr:hypothetical protein HanIR_Chr14g0707931 [Helianthus annuus]KAJ0854490.1 hypothetical protein HanRHA438_Chr14g0663181 [Helianthus annuus]